MASPWGWSAIIRSNSSAFTSRTASASACSARQGWWWCGRAPGAPTPPSCARELKVDELVQDNKKLPAFTALLERRGVAWEETAFVGDDLPDLPLLTRVGLPIAVANAVPEVKAAARVVTTLAGGQGAVREVAELILKARGEWQDQLGHLA